MRKTPKVLTGLNFYDQDYSHLPKEKQPTNQLELELAMFGMDKSEERGGLGKEAHFKNVLSMCYPWIYPSNWHEWNELILWAWANYTNVGATGAGGTHKTFTFSLLSAMEFFCRPMETAVIMTSTSLGALKTRLWPRFKEFHKLTIGDQKVPLPFHIVESKTMIQAVEGDDEHSIRAVAVDKGKVEKALGKIIGNHPGRVVLVIDEAAQTEEAVFSAKSNLAIGTTFFRCVAIANAISRFDHHGVFCEPRNGWGSVSVNDEWWETKNGVCIHLDGLKSPNVKLGEIRYPKLFSRIDVERIRKDEGEDSLEWWSQCRGFWPPSGISNTVLEENDIVAGNARDEVFWETGVTMIAALDPAFTTGGDKCILRFAKVGKFIDGTFGMQLWHRVHIQIAQGGGIPTNYQIADRCKEECEKEGVSPSNFSMDCTAASGLADIISQRWSDQIERVNFGGRASEDPVSDIDPRKSCDVYTNKVTEMWFTFARMVTGKKVRGLDRQSGIEFCTRQYKLIGEKKTVEPKAKMKERMGGASPDDADPCSLLAMRLRKMDLTRTEVPAKAPNGVDWMQLAKRHANIHARGYRAA